MAHSAHSPSLRKIRFSTSSSNDIFVFAESDGVTSMSINGGGSFEGGNVASFRIEITICPSQKIPNSENEERFFDIVFDEKSMKKINKTAHV